MIGKAAWPHLTLVQRAVFVAIYPLCCAWWCLAWVLMWHIPNFIKKVRHYE